jgi:hypothetical protein
MLCADLSLFEAMTADEIDLDRAYEVFSRSYETETGTAWSKEKFLSRARGWTFYGDANGFVAVRQQRSGMTKLVGVAGDPRSIIKGLNELQQTGGAIWGAVSASLAQMAVKRGLIAPHRYPGGPLMIRALLAMVPASVFGGETPEVSRDGGLIFHYSDVGTATKYLVGNKAYFRQAFQQPEIMQRIKMIPGAKTILRLIGV